eukprot:scaffold29674_cov26-Tisochrysis_lutea.AAC.1
MTQARAPTMAAHAACRSGAARPRPPEGQVESRAVSEPRCSIGEKAPQRGQIAWAGALRAEWCGRSPLGQSASPA